MTDMEGASFVSALNAGISEALEIADRSFDVRDEEVALIKVVALINAHPEYRQAAQESTVDLLARLEETPAPLGLVELLAYYVHVVGFPQVVEVATVRRAAALAEYEKGESGRRWEHAQAMDGTTQTCSARSVPVDLLMATSTSGTPGHRQISALQLVAPLGR